MDDARRKTLLLTLAAAVAFATPAAEARHAASPRHPKPEAEAEAEVDAAPEAAPGDPNSLALIAKGAIVIDALTGAPIYEKNANERFYPASSTKIITALLVIEAGDLDRVVVIQPEDTQVEPSAVGFKQGDQFTRRELLYALMLKSANDVAQALARDNAGSIAAFAEKMTKRAAELGATGSHFMNPHGLHNPQHYTTPHDLALIARAAMQQPAFRQFVGTQTHPWVSPEGNLELRNHNKMLWSFPGCTGLKTGYTVPAQHVLVSSALRSSREVISVVMHSDKAGKWTDSQQLLTYGFSHAPEAPKFDAKAGS